MPGTVTQDRLYKTDSRLKWDKPIEFVLSCIGYSVGLGNVWRFPYLCYKNGGASFLAVYLLLQILIGKPLYFMELSLGQYANKGPVRVWDICPAARGIGLAMCFISLNISLYYNVIMAYVLYYFFASFIPELPWTVCKDEWPDSCFTDRGKVKIPPKCKKPTNTSMVPTAIHAVCSCSGDDDIDKYYLSCNQSTIHASKFFFEKEVIQESANLSDFGSPSWKLSLLLLLSWIIVLACMVKGIQSTGKVVYFTATFPYVILFILLVRGATLNGAIDGVKFFIIPDWSLLSSSQLWIDAAGQMFFSLGLSMGGIIMFGSFNPFRHPVYRDVLIISTMDLVTSILAGFVIFTTFGYMAANTGKGILEVAASSYGLAFVAYPETLSTIAGSNLWSCLFFFMLYTLGLDSQFALLETATTYLIDDFVWCRRNKSLLRFLFAVVLYLLGIVLCCPGGQYLIAVIDIYGSAYPLSVISLLEVIAVMWIYGLKNFLNDLEYMLGKKPKGLPYWYFVWLFLDPLFLAFLFLWTMIKSETPKYADGSYFGYPVMAACWLLYFVSLSPVLIWFFLHLRAIINRRNPRDDRGLWERLLAPGPRYGPADGMHPEATRRSHTIWWDVFSTEVLPLGRDLKHTQSEHPSTMPISEVTESLAVVGGTPTSETLTVMRHSETLTMGRSVEGNMMTSRTTVEAAQSAHSPPSQSALRKGSTAVD